MSKLNHQRLQQQLTGAHSNIAAALALLADVVAVSEPGAARQGLAEIQAQLEQLYALSLMAKRRVRHWSVLFNHELIDPLPQLLTLGDIFPDDPPHDASPSADADTSAHAGDEADEAEADEDEDESDDMDGSDGYDFFMDIDEDPEPDAMSQASELDVLWDYRDHEPKQWRPSDAPIEPALIGDAELAELFGITELDAAAGVAETGYLNIFGDWVPGRRPGRYIPPASAAQSESPDATDDAADSDPDYNEPEAE